MILPLGNSQQSQNYLHCSDKKVRKMHCFIIHWKLKGMKIPYRLDIYQLLNRTCSRILRVAAASGVSQEFRIVLPPKVKIKNSTSSVYLSLYGKMNQTASYKDITLLSSSSLGARYIFTLRSKQHIKSSHYSPRIEDLSFSWFSRQNGVNMNELHIPSYLKSIQKLRTEYGQ